ncbi:MAG: DUF2125 domain-containing protein [Alphaproteobacteria bacterium]|nr:DUF2125 domain-containing protein [Alphaproteobacteria bacterium]
MSLRRALIGPAVLILLLAVGYPAYWLFAARSVEQGFADWRQARAAEGYRIDYELAEVEGFPFALQLSVVGPQIARPADGWLWHGAGIAFDMQPWNWRRFRLDAAGPHMVEVVIDARRHRLRAETESVSGVGQLNAKGRLEDGVIEIADLRLFDLSDEQLAAVRELDARLQRRGDASSSPADDGINLSLAAAEVRLGAEVQTALGSMIERLTLDATVTPRPPRGFSRAAMEAWRDDGGVAELSALHLTWGPLDIRGDGTLTVDEKMRPLGALTGQIRGYRKTLTAFERAGLIRRKHAAASRIALDLLSQRSADGNGRVVTVPLTAQNGALYIGPVRLLKLRSIPFSAPSARKSRPDPSR